MEEVSPEVEVIRVRERGKVQGVPFFAVETQMYVPAQKYSKGLYRVKLLEPIALLADEYFNGRWEILFRYLEEGSRKTKIKDFCSSCYIEAPARGRQEIGLNDPPTDSVLTLEVRCYRRVRRHCRLLHYFDGEIESMPPDRFSRKKTLRQAGNARSCTTRHSCLTPPDYATSEAFFMIHDRKALTAASSS